MEIFAFVLAVLALVLFVVAAVPRQLLAWGLAALTGAWVVQLLTVSHTVHF